MPFPSEHTARQVDPSGFKTFRRQHPKGFPKGIDVIFGIAQDGKSAIQTVRFDSKEWTADKAKKWLKDHGMKSGDFEQATEKNVVSWKGVI
jgi:hypothetical protein